MEQTVFECQVHFFFVLRSAMFYAKSADLNKMSCFVVVDTDINRFNECYRVAFTIQPRDLIRVK